MPLPDGPGARDGAPGGLKQRQASLDRSIAAADHVGHGLALGAGLAALTGASTTQSSKAQRPAAIFAIEEGSTVL